MARPINTIKKEIRKCKMCDNIFEVYKKDTKTYCSKKCANADIEVKNKIKQSQKNTFEKKYGCHPMQTDETKNNLKAALSSKYGVEHYSQLDEWKNKVKNTLKLRYNDDTFNNRQKAINTNLKKYGVDNPLKCGKIKDKVMDSKKRKHYDFLKSKLEKDGLYTLEFQQEEYKGYKYENKYKFRCNTCNHSFESDVYLLDNIRCQVCNPITKYEGENELYNFLKEICNSEIAWRDRKVLNGYELDFYIPQKKIAIEYNGLYWHSEFKGKRNKTYHLNKLNKCLTNGVRLIHIYENEWIYKKNIIKSILSNILTENKNYIYARNCEVKIITNKIKSSFLNENHLQGDDKSKILYGLYYKNDLVSVMTFCKSRFNKKYEYELSRYSIKLGYTIVGGAAKLFSVFKKEYVPSSIITYSDRRFFQGDIYSKLNFNFIKNTPPNYFYISKDYKILYNRMHYQKKKLKKLFTNYNDSLTEYQNMLNNGHDRIWDCGVSVWGWNI
jgi:very-short-patch-repair endonuclease